MSSEEVVPDLVPAEPERFEPGTPAYFIAEHKKLLKNPMVQQVELENIKWLDVNWNKATIDEMASRCDFVTKGMLTEANSQQREKFFEVAKNKLLNLHVGDNMTSTMIANFAAVFKAKGMGNDEWKEFLKKIAPRETIE